MISKNLEVIIERIKTLNREELKQLSNEIDAEIIFRNKEWIKDFSVPYYKSTEDKENV